MHYISRLPEIRDCDKTLLCHCMTLTRVERIVYVGSRHATAAAAAGMFYILLHADRISAHAEPRRTRALTRLRLSGAVSRPRATCHISSLYISRYMRLTTERQPVSVDVTYTHRHHCRCTQPKINVHSVQRRTVT